MSELVAVLPAKEKYLSIVWQVNNWCNFRCSYCNEHNWSGSYRNKEADKYKAVLEKIFHHFRAKGYESYKIFFSGGEPSYWPCLIDICEFSKSQNLPGLKFAINTNLSRPLAWWEEHYHYFDDVVASFHIEGAKADRYLENFKFLQDKVNYLAARMMMHDDHFEEVIAFSQRLKSECYNYVLEYVPLFEELSNKTVPYKYKDPKKMEFFKNCSLEVHKAKEVPPRSKCNTSSMEYYADGNSMPLNSNKIVSERNNFFKGWHCSLNDSIFINAKGEITAGTCGVKPMIGNINEGRIEFLEDSIVCPKYQCHCGTDIYIPKVHPKWKNKFQQGFEHGYS